jgi:hypothetical protein
MTMTNFAQPPHHDDAIPTIGLRHRRMIVLGHTWS